MYYFMDIQAVLWGMRGLEIGLWLVQIDISISAGRGKIWLPACTGKCLKVGKLMQNTFLFFLF